MSRRFVSVRSSRVFAMAALAIVPLAFPVLATASTIPPDADLAVVDQAVIAQSLVEFPAGSFRWTSEALPLATPYELTSTLPTFLLATDGDPALVRTSSSAALVEAGTAVFVSPGSDGSVSGSGADATAAHRITFEEAADGFDPGTSEREVELVRYFLGQDATITIDSSFLAYVIVLDGAVFAGPTALANGQFTEIPAGASITNAGTEPAVVVAGQVGDVVAATPAPPETPATNAPVTTVGGSGGSPTTPPAPTTTAPPALRQPAAQDDSADGNGTITINVLSNDDLGNPAATITGVQTGSVGETIDVGNGTFVLNANGTATYQPTFSDVQSTYSTTYTISNSEGSSTAVITVTNNP